MKKKKLIIFTLAVLSIGLLGSCSDDDRIDELEQRIGGLENNRIATIDSQISAINASIADLEAIRTNIKNLTNATGTQADDIAKLKAADTAIGQRIDELKQFIEDGLKGYATKDWVNATFATLAQYQATSDALATLDVRVGDLDAKLSGKIDQCATTLKTWVNSQLDGYYTVAQMDAKLADLQAQLAAAATQGEANKAKADSIATELAKAKADIETAKADLRTEYQAAIEQAITKSEGKLTKALQEAIADVNGQLGALDVRVSKLEYLVADLTGRVDAIENRVNTIDGQILAINQSIADLEAIRANIKNLTNATGTQAADIAKLKEADVALGQRIDELKQFIENNLKDYATRDWVNNTFATLEQHQWTCDTIAKIDARIGQLDARLSQAIEQGAEQVKQWVNQQLSAYYTAAQMDAKLGVLQAQVDSIGQDNKAKADSIGAELAKTKAAIDTAKVNIRTEYQATIKSAIETSEGKLTKALQDSIAKVNGRVEALGIRVDQLEADMAALKGRVDAIEQMIQTVTIIPAYSDGSVLAVDSLLAMDFIVKPRAAVEGLTADNLKILAKKVLARAVSVDTIPVAIVGKDATKGAISITADIAKMASVAGKSVSVALDVKSGLSDYTTAFVGVVFKRSLCITATTAETGQSVRIDKNGSPAAVTLQASTDARNWTDYTFGEEIPLSSAGDKVYFRNKAAAEDVAGFSKNISNCYQFVLGSGQYAASGNVMSLVDKDCSTTTIPNNGCFFRLFYGCSALTTAPELPATNLADSCYMSMFQYCSSLTTAPELPATNLAGYCYCIMFYGCSSLITAPELPATTLATSCYHGMFYSCSALTTAPELPATNLAEDCYMNMFQNCKSLTTAPELPATNLAEDCYYYMFNNCTKLTTAPELPATNLATSCYHGMFQYCSSLTTAPELPATTLATSCYQGMFYGCTKLTTAPELPATTLIANCYQYMFQGCTKLTTAPELPATNLAEDCYYYMFRNCESLNYIKVGFTEWDPINATTSWVEGVSATGTFICPEALQKKTGTDNIPSGWIINPGPK